MELHHPSQSANALVAIISCRILSEEQRQRAVESIERLAVQTPDADFLRMTRLRELLTEDEVLSILARVEKELVGDLDQEIDGWDSGYSSDDDPDEYYGPYIEALGTYREELAHCPVSSRILEKGINRLKQLLADRTSEFTPKEEPSDLTLGQLREAPLGGRNIFDDVDE